MMPGVYYITFLGSLLLMVLLLMTMMPHQQQHHASSRTTTTPLHDAGDSITTTTTSSSSSNNEEEDSEIQDVASHQHHHRRERQLQGEEPLCFNGFVMDVFCINRGTLLDQSSVKTLEGPDRHTLHCLLDVDRCVNSGYELLLDPEQGGSDSKYARAFTLDDAGNRLVLSLARSLGDCGTCSNNAGSQDRGFRATVVGTMVATVLSDDSSTIMMPPLLKVTELRTTDQPCTEDEGGQFVPTLITFESGGGSAGIDAVALHGGLMATAWGFLLPLGVLSSRFLRHRPGGLWFILHRAFNILGVVLTIIGVIVAFASFDNVFSDGGGPSYQHGVMGLTTMSLGILQAANGILRPHHAPQEDEQKDKKRFIWELIHKCTGYGTIALGYATIYYGAQIAGLKKQDTFMGVFYATFAFAGVVAIAMIGDKLCLYRDDDMMDRKERNLGLEVSNSAFQEEDVVVKDAKA